ncbi:unnamed protein product [Protopolystoma xenopodis]|uniref:Uncharacterized protein n=1 Tax=Protopolystoma xenopodis TaxID=117903 RepID=A0A448X960_9PLAT|nr:unnamed protein product [Protopolystoma xenopodis]
MYPNSSFNLLIFIALNYHIFFCFLILVDDGTGILPCTLWRRDPIPPPPYPFAFGHGQETCTHSRLTCRTLIGLAFDSYALAPSIATDPSHSSLSEWGLYTKRTCLLRIGQHVILRGRLKRYRCQLRMNADYCR